MNGPAIKRAMKHAAYATSVLATMDAKERAWKSLVDLARVELEAALTALGPPSTQKELTL